jgi:hypothetical protein
VAEQDFIGGQSVILLWLCDHAFGFTLFVYRSLQ